MTQMTVREQMALKMLVETHRSHMEIAMHCLKHAEVLPSASEQEMSPGGMASAAVRFADALILELAKT